MLYISLREGDYVMIGDEVKVSYSHLNGKDGLVLGFDAPRDVQILRGKHYEAEIARMAEEGNEEAKAKSEKLAEERRAKQRSYGARRSRREEQDRRIESGEIRPYHQRENQREKPARAASL